MPTLFSSSLWYTLLGRLIGYDASEYTERWDIASRRERNDRLLPLEI